MSTPLTRVGLTRRKPGINVYLRFGAPAKWRWHNAYVRQAFFTPHSVLCRVWWQRNAYGTAVWQVLILRAGAPGDHLQAVLGIDPGAAVLLQAKSERATRRVLRVIAAIEARNIAPTDVAPTYWQAVQNRLSGRGQFGIYGRDRHDAQRLRPVLR